MTDRKSSPILSAVRAMHAAQDNPGRDPYNSHSPRADVWSGHQATIAQAEKADEMLRDTAMELKP